MGQPAISDCGRGTLRCQEAAQAALLAFAAELDGQAGWAARNWAFGDAMTLQRAAYLARERAGELAGEAPGVTAVPSGALNGRGPQGASEQAWWDSPSGF
jgi:hypothetical protein